jgi:hypothetical protein
MIEIRAILYFLCQLSRGSDVKGELYFSNGWILLNGRTECLAQFLLPVTN